MTIPDKYFYASQRAWIEDDSPLKLCVKSRQTGFSFATCFRLVLQVSDFPVATPRSSLPFEFTWDPGTPLGRLWDASKMHNPSVNRALGRWDGFFYPLPRKIFFRVATPGSSLPVRTHVGRRDAFGTPQKCTIPR